MMIIIIIMMMMQAMIILQTSARVLGPELRCTACDRQLLCIWGVAIITPG